VHHTLGTIAPRLAMYSLPRLFLRGVAKTSSSSRPLSGWELKAER